MNLISGDTLYVKKPAAAAPDTPTPRTDALFAEWQDIQNIDLLESEVRKIERELAAAQKELETAEFDCLIACDLARREMDSRPETLPEQFWRKRAERAQAELSAAQEELKERETSAKRWRVQSENAMEMLKEANAQIEANEIIYSTMQSDLAAARAQIEALRNLQTSEQPIAWMGLEQRKGYTAKMFANERDDFYRYPVFFHPESAPALAAAQARLEAMLAAIDAAMKEKP
jgi:chromosome segregation ATPase